MSPIPTILVCLTPSPLFLFALGAIVISKRPGPITCNLRVALGLAVTAHLPRFSASNFGTPHHVIMTMYNSVNEPENHIERLRSTNRPVPSHPSYGLDSPLGLIASSVLSPLYLYASLRGKFDAWDKLLDELPPGIFSSPALDIGCGRGLVLLKIAQRKKALSAQSEAHSIGRAYGVDLFIKADQSGNSAESTYDNGASLELLDYLVLHTADFTQLPFQDETMALVTASLSIHNADKVSRKKAIVEAARVLQPGGFLVILELGGYISQYKSELKSIGWTDLVTAFGGLQVMFGAWPCQILRARKPALEG